MVKQVKVGLVLGKGPPPGYRWGVQYLSTASNEAGSLLNEAQYAHAVDLLRALAYEDAPTSPKSVDVDAVEDFHELRDKGGILGKINLRIFFAVDGKSRTIVVLGVIKKEAEGPTPSWIKTRIRSRIRALRQMGWSV
jgi:hypothetical protein